MSFETRCPQCLFISSQLAQRTPCLLHVSVGFDVQPPVAVKRSVSPELDYDEPYAFGQLRPTVDRPGPFTIREYVRLQLLRSRIQAELSPVDALSTCVPVHSLAQR
jgi:hypothetical protein